MHQEVKFDYIAELTGTRDQFEYLNESRHSIYATTDKPIYNVCTATLNVKFLFISYAPNFTSLHIQSISNDHYVVHLIFYRHTSGSVFTVRADKYDAKYITDQ